MASNLNVPTNRLPLNRDVFTMFLASYVLKKVEGLLVTLLLEFCMENLLL